MQGTQKIVRVKTLRKYFLNWAPDPLLAPLLFHQRRERLEVDLPPEVVQLAAYFHRCEEHSVVDLLAPDAVVLVGPAIRPSLLLAVSNANCLILLF